LCAAISGGSRLLCDAAARTANIFIEYYGPELDPTALISVVLDACIDCVTDDLLLVFGALLEATRDSEDIFDAAFPFLREVIVNGCLELQTAALAALGALSIGSTVKIILNFDELYQLLMGLIQNPTAYPIRGLLVECLTRSSTAVGHLFESRVPELCGFCLENIGSDDMSFAVSCLSSLEQICGRWPGAFQPLVETVMPVMCDLASTDASPAYRGNIALAIHDAGFGESETVVDLELTDMSSFSQFMASAISLRILSMIVEKNRDLCPQYASHIVHCCEIQRDSTAHVCKRAAAFAVGRLAEAMVCTSDSRELTSRMGHIILGVIFDCQNFEPTNPENSSAELLIESFQAAAKVIEWLDYKALGSCIGELLDKSTEIIVKISETFSLGVYVGELIDSIFGFLTLWIQSAEDELTVLLAKFLPLFQDLTEHPDVRFQSLALRFFACVISVSSERFEPELKVSWCLLALRLATEKGDRNAFVLLKTIAVKEPAFAAQFGGQVAQLCLQTLALPVIKSERFLVTRDNCVATLAAFAMNVFDDAFNIADCLQLVLGALPLVIDFTESVLVTEFVLWLHAKVGGECPELFAGPLIVLLANPQTVLSKIPFTERVLVDLIEFLRTLLKKVENPEAFMLGALDGDVARKGFLDSYLGDG
jgi:hypothetical protein